MLTDVSQKGEQMMSKSPETRKEELLAAAEELFRTNGVDRTAVSDIVKRAGVAQGTFYNYYRSKEEIFAAVLDRATRHFIEEIQKTAQRKDLGVEEKLNLISQQDFLLNRENDPLFDVLHEPRYAYAHQKYIVGRILKLQPIYVELIRQGVKEKLYDTPYPEQTALLFLTAMKFVFDPAFFSHSKEEMLGLAEALQEIGTRAIGAKKEIPLPEELRQGILQYDDKG